MLLLVFVWFSLLYFVWFDVVYDLDALLLLVLGCDVACIVLNVLLFMYGVRRLG